MSLLQVYAEVLVQLITCDKLNKRHICIQTQLNQIDICDFF